MNDYKFYLNLTEKESIEYANKSLSEITDEDQLEDVLIHLALFTNGNCLKPHYIKLINKEVVQRGEIYLHADEKVADKLIELIENNSEYVDDLLCCLAWIGTQNVINFLIKSSAEKSNWAKELYVLPKGYANRAGWCIDEQNRKQYLISKDVFVFARQDFKGNNESEIKTFIETNLACKFCKNDLTIVFETKINSARIPFTTCLLCSAYEPFFMNVDEKGNSSWNNANKKWEHLDRVGFEIEKIKENTLVITNEKRKPEFTISQFVEISKSQIGGYPTWVQHTDYLNCPDCNQKMPYIGQVDMEDVEDYNEGIYYFHYCKKCKITGTNYQQT